jgi:hypothetical protein
MLVSTKIRKPSETSPSRLIAILYLIDKLFDLGVFSNGQRAKGVVNNAGRPFAATRSKALQTQPNDFFDLLVLGNNQFSGLIFIARIAKSPCERF